MERQNPGHQLSRGQAGWQMRPGSLGFAGGLGLARPLPPASHKASTEAVRQLGVQALHTHTLRGTHMSTRTHITPTSQGTCARNM